MVEHRSPKPGVGGSKPLAPANDGNKHKIMSKLNVINFIDQVKQETSKVTWPSKKETMTSTMTVVVMVTLASMFFLLVDWMIHNLVQLLLTIGN